MKLPQQFPANHGIALILVMIVVISLGILAGGFAYSMKVETRLALNHQYEADLAWLGRSGVEYAKYILAQQLLFGNEPFDALNQFWAGGTGSTNAIFNELSLENVPVGPGKISLHITDAESKYNINVANPVILQQALVMVGADVAEYSAISDSILDWIDPDDDPRISGHETDYYESLPDPYVAKNGPIDNVEELLLVYGVTPGIYFGFDEQAGIRGFETRFPSNYGEPLFTGGLEDLFTAVSSSQINLNTASIGVLQLIPGIDERIAEGIVQYRSGLDGIAGNEDDTPFRNPSELVNVPGIHPQAVQGAASFFTVRSATFIVEIKAEMGHLSRTYTALLRRNSPQNIQVLNFSWN